MNITEQQLKDLEVYLLELPAKFANPILQFLAQIKKEQETNSIINSEHKK